MTRQQCMGQQSRISAWPDAKVLRWPIKSGRNTEK